MVVIVKTSTMERQCQQIPAPKPAPRQAGSSSQAPVRTLAIPGIFSFCSPGSEPRTTAKIWKKTSSCTE